MMRTVVSRALSVPIASAVVVCALVAVFVVLAMRPSGPGADYTDITSVPVDVHPPAVLPGAAGGSYADRCGEDADGRHLNADNVIADPGQPGGAHHTHAYVGNLSTGAFSTDAGLAAAGTTCLDGDRSTFYWPVLRLPDQPGPDAHAVGGGLDGNVGRILVPASVDVRFLGNPVSQVVPMPRFLRGGVGDAKALTDGATGRAAPHWSCTGYTDRVTRLYPLCPTGSNVLRIFDFPSCWDGRSLDSPSHHTQLVAPDGNGLCPHATFPVPHLRITVGYAVPAGESYALDTFPAQRHSPLTDHADFINVMTEQAQAQVVACLNTGRQC